MHPTKSLAGVALAASVLAACSFASAMDAWTATVDRSFSTSGGVWNVGGRLVISAKAIDAGGVTAICGAWLIENDRNLEDDVQQVLAQGQIRIGEMTVTKHLNHFSRVNGATDLSGASASCRTTGTPWKPAFATMPVEIKLFRTSGATTRADNNKIPRKFTPRASEPGAL